MRAEAEPKPRSRRNESARGALVARFGAWVGPFSYECDVQKGLPMPQTGSHCRAIKRMMNRWLLCPAVNADVVDLAGPEGTGAMFLHCADGHIGGRFRQTVLSVFGHENTVHVEPSVHIVPSKG